MARMQDPGDRLAGLARALREQVGEADTVDRALQLVAETVAGCDEVTVSQLGRRPRVQTLRAYGDRARRADGLQYELNEGPCLSSIRERATVLAPDLATEPRWPGWSRRVHRELGFGSVLCFRLYTENNEYGALNLYSDRADAFDDHDQAVGLAMAAHIAVALSSARQLDSMSRSMDGRSAVGQAIGIVRERYGLDSAGALEFLQRISSTTNTRVLVIADHLVATGQLPDPPTAA